MCRQHYVFIMSFSKLPIHESGTTVPLFLFSCCLAALLLNLAPTFAKLSSTAMCAKDCRNSFIRATMQPVGLFEINWNQLKQNTFQHSSVELLHSEPTRHELDTSGTKGDLITHLAVSIEQHRQWTLCSQASPVRAQSLIVVGAAQVTPVRTLLWNSCPRPVSCN